MKNPTIERLVLLAFLLILVVFGALVARKYILSTPPEPSPAVEIQTPRQLRDVTLYFGASDGAYLVAEGREIEDCLEEEGCVAEAVHALVNGPLGDLAPILPSHVVVRGVRVENGTATVDFSRALVDGHPGGSVSELLTVYGLVNTLAVNFPHIRQIRVLVEGEAVDSIKGHVDLREPVVADFLYGRPPEGAEISETIVVEEGLIEEIIEEGVIEEGAPVEEIKY